MKHDFTRAVAFLQAGELVAFPTETVYGLGADAANPAAVAKIFTAKGRPADHPLIVHLPGSDYLGRWAKDVPAVAWKLAEAFWPGPLTLILGRGPDVPYAVTGGQETVGLRVPSHPVALELLRAFAQAGGGSQGMCGVAAPSANRFGRISPTEAVHVHAELGNSVAMVIDGGPCHVGIESTIIDLSGGEGQPLRLLRPGHITPEEIAGVAGALPEEAWLGEGGVVPRVSGSLEAHYAPRTPLRIVDGPQIVELLTRLKREGKRVGILVCHQAEIPFAEVSLRLPANPESYARGFYAALRELDEADCDLLVVEGIPASGVWSAVADRLRRAAFGSQSR